MKKITILSCVISILLFANADFSTATTILENGDKEEKITYLNGSYKYLFFVNSSNDIKNPKEQLQREEEYNSITNVISFKEYSKGKLIIEDIVKPKDKEHSKFIKLYSKYFYQGKLVKEVVFFKDYQEDTIYDENKTIISKQQSKYK